jgi:hypothetical protein
MMIVGVRTKQASLLPEGRPCHVIVGGVDAMVSFSFDDNLLPLLLPVIDVGFKLPLEPTVALQCIDNSKSIASG